MKLFLGFVFPFFQKSEVVQNASKLDLSAPIPIKGLGVYERDSARFLIMISKLDDINCFFCE